MPKMLLKNQDIHVNKIAYKNLGYLKTEISKAVRRFFEEPSHFRTKLDQDKMRSALKDVKQLNEKISNVMKRMYKVLY